MFSIKCGNDLFRLMSRNRNPRTCTIIYKQTKCVGIHIVLQTHLPQYGNGLKVIIHHPYKIFHCYRMTDTI